MSTRFRSTELSSIPRLLGWLGLILMCCFTNAVFAGQVTLAWDASSSPDVGGYKVVYGQSSGAYTSEVDVGKQTSNIVANLDDSKTYYFAVRAYNTDKTAESANSNEVSKPASVTTPPPSTALPSPWIDMDIGNVGLVGSASYTNGTFTVNGSGDDIWNNADAFHFAYQPLNGDGAIVARVVSVGNTAQWAKTGVMIRESLDANARNAFVLVSPNTGGVFFQYRSAIGGSTVEKAGAVVSAPYWVKLARAGNTFTAYQSANGTTWAQIGSTTLSMAASIYVGLAVTSTNNSALNTSVLDGVSVQTSDGTGSTATVAYTFNSQPSGLSLSYDGASRVTPFTVDAEVGSQHAIGAPASQSNYNFSAWSDGGAATHTLTIGTSPQTLTANYVVATPAPTADFSANQTTGNAPLTVSFSDKSSGSVNSWAWSFGDGGVSSTASPSHTYSNTGTYSVSLTVTGPGGSNTTTKTNYITVKEAAPVASFTTSPNSGTAPLLVTFTDTSTGSISSRAWKFSDGTSDTAQKVVKTFNTAGNYTATLTVTGPGGSTTATQTITATTAAAPTVNFSASPTSGTAPLAVSFFNSSSGDIQSWSWTFGDGGTSTAQNPVYTYAKAGTYTVSLTVTTSSGSTVSKTLTGYITVNADSGKPIACASTSSIWPSDAAPATTTADPDTQGVELGVKFKSDVDGYICGIRFYKFSANTGTHVGSLWSDKGQLLARASFANETAAGWQQVSFDQPVAVSANTVYVASYYAPNGGYAVDTNYFASAGIDNGSLHALRDGESGGNSVYLYGGGFPASSWKSSNYWVDVTFSTGAASSWLEAGEITLGGGWQQVKFAKPFSDPVVVANPLNFDAADPGVIRIRNVNATGFEIRSQAWDYLGGSSIAGKVGYLAMERGSHTLDDGTQVEAGRVDTSLTGSFGKVTFAKPFSVAPVVITGVASVNEESAVVTRVKSVTGTSFYVGMQEEEANKQVHATETIAYIAWQPSSGTVEGLDFQVSRTANIVTDKFYTVAYPKAVTTLPVFLADMQTTNGGDTANLRWQNKTLSSVQVKVAEEQSKGSETTHGKEVVGYILLTPKQ